MKKIISFVLVLTMLFSVTVPAVSALDEYIFTGSQIPVVALFGDGEAIYDTEGNKVFHFKEMFSMLTGGEEGALGEATINVLKPFLLEGIINDEWDNYYAALEKEIGEIFTEARYDENGENWNGTDVSKDVRKYMENFLKRDSKKNGGSYRVYDYQFWYDWRQDPLKTADEFHEYIEGVKKVTGAEKVSILARCLGTTVVMAYIAKYGTDSIHGVSFNGSVAAGGEIISESISGKFVLDVNAINRMISDFESIGWFDVDSFITSSIDLVAKTLTVTGFELNETELYGKLLQGVTSALALSTFFTWPGYWALVCEEDYEDALYYVFGEEGSEKRETYKNLIAKIDNYQTTVMSQMDNILQKIKDDELKIGVIAKYGYQLAPIAESRDYVADQFATVNKASFGATTSTVYEPLDKQYIAARIAEGKGKYISPDRRIDASTCFFPDSTWFTKGITHSEWTDFETALLYKVITADEQLTVDDFNLTQFVVFDHETMRAYPMTKNNCDTESWKADIAYDKPETQEQKIFAAVRAIIVWVFELIKFLNEKYPIEETLASLKK